MRLHLFDFTVVAAGCVLLALCWLRERSTNRDAASVSEFETLRKATTPVDRLNLSPGARRDLDRVARDAGKVGRP